VSSGAAFELRLHDATERETRKEISKQRCIGKDVANSLHPSSGNGKLSGASRSIRQGIAGAELAADVLSGS